MWDKEEDSCEKCCLALFDLCFILVGKGHIEQGKGMILRILGLLVHQTATAVGLVCQASLFGVSVTEAYV